MPIRNARHEEKVEKDHLEMPGNTGIEKISMPWKPITQKKITFLDTGTTPNVFFLWNDSKLLGTIGTIAPFSYTDYEAAENNCRGDFFQIEGTHLSGIEKETTQSLTERVLLKIHFPQDIFTNWNPATAIFETERIYTFTANMPHILSTLWPAVWWSWKAEICAYHLTSQDNGSYHKQADANAGSGYSAIGQRRKYHRPQADCHETVGGTTGSTDNCWILRTGPMTIFAACYLKNIIRPARMRRRRFIKTRRWSTCHRSAPMQRRGGRRKRELLF